MDKRDFMEINKSNWNEMTPVHYRSPLYAVEEFKCGKCSLPDFEIRELGDVKGKSLLHLQCHFGMDTLSWARLGAKATGIDFSDVAIEYAKKLSEEINVKAAFICSNLYDLDKKLTGEFDIVYTSSGVLCWLPDLREWGRMISRFLKRNGLFYIKESHPFGNTFSDEKDVKDLRVFYPYFQGPEPMTFPPGPSYAYTEKDGKISNPSYEWFHTMSEIINALIQNGLIVQFLHEFPFSGYKHLPFLVQEEDGFWHLPNGRKDIPLLFSLMAKKK